MSGFITAKFVIKVRACVAEAKFIIKVRACVAEDVVSFTDTVWLLGVVPIAVWLADTVPAWLAGEEVALPEFAGAELWLAADTVTWVAGVAWLAVAAEPDPLTPPPDAPETALVATVAAWATGAWLVRL